VGAVVFDNEKYKNSGWRNVMGKRAETGFIFWLARFATYLYASFFFVFLSPGLVVDQNGHTLYVGCSSLSLFCSILLSVFVPISLWVTMEIVRFVQARFMQWDLEMAVPNEEKMLKKKKKKKKAQQQTKTPDDESSEEEEPDMLGMVAKTSNLNEDLGRVRLTLHPRFLTNLSLDRAHLLGQDRHAYAKQDDLPLELRRSW
jgi:magnesium-transporting ATPase (P-type)